MLRVVTLAPQALDSLAATCAYPFLLVQESQQTPRNSPTSSKKK